MYSDPLTPYPAYKPSGVDWLGDVPEHWEVRRLKQVCRLAYGDSLATESRQPGQVPVYGSNGQIARHSVANTQAPCIIIGRKGSFGKVTYVDRDAFAIDTTFFIDQRYTRANIPLLSYLLPLLELDAVSHDSAVPGLNRNDAYAVSIPLPPLAEQATIVRYLDHVDRRVRRYVGAKRRLIALLEEERQAVVNQAVTRGLDHGVRLKPSGVDWLGDVPEHWDVRRLKQVCRLAYGDSLATESRQPGEVPVYGPNGQIGKHSVANTQAPCIIIGLRKGSFGKVTFVDRTAFAIDTTFFIDKRYTRANVRWLSYMLPLLKMDAVSHDSAVPGLNREDAYDSSIPLPPLAEQAAIVEYLNNATARIDAAIARARRQIELLEEYRTRLIADVVTGKLDVRQAAAQLPEEAGDGAPVDDDGFIVDNWDDDLDASQPPEEETAP